MYICHCNANIQKELKVLEMKRFKLIIMLFAVLSCTAKSFASDDKGSVDAGNLIIGHITDSYSWHICSIGEKHISIPLPVILIHDGNFDVFMSSKFHHGHESYKGYKIIGGGITKERILRLCCQVGRFSQMGNAQ